MKKQLLLILLGLFIVFNSCTDYNKKINLMTYNIRLNTETDSINKWDNRKEGIVNLIKEENVDILGIQEALPDQIEYLSNQLKDYDYVGEGRDGGNSGEYSAIYYKRERMNLIETETFWLSETPEIPSMGWDAVINRIVTLGVFKIKNLGKELIIYNFETRLTILAFFYIGLIYICLRYFNLKKIKLRYHFIIYTILISLVIIFSESNNLGIHQITFGNLIINTESLLDRVNINLISFFAFLNYPFGYGFEMFTAYLDFLYIPSIHLGNYNYKELYGSFITFHNFEYLNVHRDFSRSHGGILNILTSFGIFIFPLYYSLRNFNKMQKKFYYDFYLYILIKTSILFIILASLINYTFEIEILCILISVFFIKMRNLTNEN